MQTSTAAAESPTASVQRAGSAKLARLLRQYTLLLALVAVWVIFAWQTGGVFTGARNFSNLMRQTAVTGVLAVGMLLVILIAQIDLSVGSLVGFTGMIAALVQARSNAGFAVAAALAIGLGVGALQGILSERAEIPSFIVTLGGLLVWRGATQGASAGSTIPLSSPAL